MRQRFHFVLPFLILGILFTYASPARAADPFEWTGTHAHGDFDADGETDRVASSPQSDCNEGAVYVLMGSGGGATWTEDTLGVLGTATCDDYFGAALAVGDFDGDGYDDLAIGTPGGSDSGYSNSGSVHILYGSSTGLTATGDQLWHQDSSGIEGVAEVDDQLGSALTVGDFNCDGYDDLAVGTPGEAVGTIAGAGAVNVIFGSSSGLSTLNSIWYQGTGGADGTVETDDYFGAAVAGGNFNGDTSNGIACDDLAIGAPNEDQSSAVVDSGHVYIIDGSTSGLSNIGDQGIDQDVTDVADTAEFDDQLGLRLEARDLDGDGYDDLWATVPGDGCSTSDGWGRHQFRGTSGGLSFNDDVVTCDQFDCAIASGVYACEAAYRPVHGSSGTEDLAVHFGDDIVYGWGGADTITPGGGQDLVFGGLGNDTLHASAGRDILVGGSGDDSIYVDLDCEVDPGDVIDGGPGSDTVYSHLSQAELAAVGVAIFSVETFVSVSEDDSDEDESCGLPVLSGNVQAGSACFGLELNCAVPQSVGLSLDQEAVFVWGGERTSPPETVCIDTNEVSETQHDFVLSVGCDDAVVTS